MEFEDAAKKKFDSSLSDRERAIFECGISLGAMYHQFVGTPIFKANLEILEKAIKSCIESQPFIEEVDVKITPPKDLRGVSPYVFYEISGYNLRAKVISRYGKYRVVGRLEYDEELNYPLMYIERVEKVDS